ncbi:MAG: LysR substrate-binding domain-containing protein [Pseudoxanthomonas sp.]
MTHDLNDTLIFVKVVEQGSFIGAANLLGLPKTTVSRKVQELESRLGAQLLHRTTRKLGLTEAGGVYFEHSRQISHALNEAESAVNQLQSGPRGWLRFTVPYSVGITWIAPLLGPFHVLYPEIRVDMHLGNETQDLIDGDFDLALRGGSLADSALVARKLGTLRTQVFASPAYIARHGEPLHPDELQFHRILAMRKGPGNRFAWQLSDGGELKEYPVDPLLVANDPAALQGALICGEGITMAPDVMVKPFVENGLLRRVLPGWTGPEYDFSAVFPGGRLVSPKVRAFVDFLVERLNFDAHYMLTQCPNMLAGRAAAGLALDEATRRQKRPEPVAVD